MRMRLIGIRSVSKVKLGDAEIKLMDQRELVDFAVEWMEENR